MTRVFTAGIVVFSLVGLGAAVVAQQPQKPPPNDPGKPTQAKVLVINHARTEAVPVTIVSEVSDPVRTTVVGTPSVTVTGLVEARAARQMWEYRQVALAAGQDAAPVLNGLGQDGWEAVGVSPGSSTASTVLLKRPR